MKIVSHRKNNFDFIRIIAAYMVLFSHSYTLYGRHAEEPLGKYSGFIEFGTLGVFIFFIISGYLITESYLRDPNLNAFFIKRIFRIVPGLWVVLFLSAVILGPILTTEPLESYFQSIIFFKYLRGFWFFKISFQLPGVFSENPYPHIVNGSLWSIPIEFAMYILLFISGKLNFLRIKPLFIILTILFSMWLFLPEKQLTEFIFDMNKAQLLKCGIMFFMGSFLQICSFKQYLNQKITTGFILSLFGASIFFLPSKFGLLILFFVLPLITLYLSFASWIKLQKIFAFGDFSYGIYLYAFPVQQTLIYFFKNKFSLMGFILTSAVITLFFGILSWFLIEKPLIEYSRKLLKNNNIIG
jgi:peptidoglycan/LPS O-acetylase OafA/YrhL